jgi:phage shock protein A
MVGAVLVAVGVAGCGSSNSSASAEDKVCAARADVRDSLAKVADDVRAGNLGDAKDALGDVQTAVDGLKSAIAELGAQERDKLQPQLDQLRTDMDHLRAANSLSAVQAAAATAAMHLATLVSSIQSDLNCSD